MSGEGPDVEGAVKAYLAADAGVIASAAGGRVFLAVKRPTFPYVTVIRIAGGEDTSDAPIDNALLQIDVLGRVGELDEANTVRRAVRAALANLNRSPYTVAGKARLLGSVVRDERRFPEPDAQDGDVIGERPRYILTVQVTAIDAPAP